MRPRALLVACAALACATSRPPPSETTTGPGARPAAPAATAVAPSAPAVTPGLDAAEVRRRLGAPQRVERVPSAAARGASYERWTYPDREVVLLDGKVIDVVP